MSIPTVTGYSEFWGGANSYAVLFGRASPEAMLSRAFARRGNGAVRRLFTNLLGTAAGQTATETYVRPSAPAGLTESVRFGGLRTNETVTQINRASVAADVTSTALIATRLFSMAPAIASYPVDAGGNGGGGKGGV